MKSKQGILGIGAVFAVLTIFGYSSDVFAFGWPHPPHPHHPHHCFHGPHFGLGFHVAPRPSGHYEMVTEQVMVEPQRVEKYWVPAEYQTVTDPSTGKVTTVKVRDGYMAGRVIPARYATVTRQVWVPSYSPSLGIGFGFRF